MRFELQIRNIQGAKRVILPFLCTYPRSFGRVEAVIDTGAPQTILSAKDAIRLNMPFKSFPSAKPIRGFGKGNTPALSIKNFQISLHSIENQRASFKFPIVAIDVPTLYKRGKGALDSALTLPSLIGLDFLDVNELQLFVDLNNNEAYLEGDK